MSKQKDVFLESEGNAWFARNRQALAKRKLPDDDPILRELIEVFSTQTRNISILEIGCGDGNRLAWLKANLSASCSGIDPSAEAVAVAREKGIDARQGTADSLPFDNQAFDVVIFGFCLYLCDRQDLFQIAAEADRVLRSSGWLFILDFYSADLAANKYHHKPGIFSYKMDYRKLFLWHPQYICMTQKVRHHESLAYTDSANDWIAISVLRKQLLETSL